MKRPRKPQPMPKKNTDKAAGWLRAALAAENDPETHKRLQGVADALNRYRWMADELALWWERRSPIDPNG